jgi:hypothetical protein
MALSTSITQDSNSQNLVKNVGIHLKTLVGTIDFDSSYPTGGESFDVSSYFPVDVLGVTFFPQDGYVFAYDEDNKKVKAYEQLGLGTLNLIDTASGNTLTVTDTDSPGGNAVYLKYTTDGKPYLCCDMANDSADKILAFSSSIKVRIIDDGSASGGTQVYFDEDGTQPDRLLADLSTVDADAYIETNTPGYYLKVKNDSSASTNGVALNYDDGADDQLEATTDGDADADLDLATNTVSSDSTLTEVDNTTDLSGVTGVRFLALGY